MMLNFCTIRFLKLTCAEVPDIFQQYYCQYLQKLRKAFHYLRKQSVTTIESGTAELGAFNALLAKKKVRSV